MQRDHAVVVRRALVHEVDDDARLLARVHAHDPADPLLVDAAARGRGEVHDDGRARRVPALREQHRVDQDVDLSPLVGGEDLGQLDRRRAPADGLGLETRGAELLGEVVGVVDTGRVDDPGRRVEPVAVEARGGLVQSRVVESGGEGALLEVAADDRHRVDRGRGRNPEVPQRGDQASSGRVLQGQVVDRGGEDVGDLLRDQLFRRGHPDVDRVREASDREARLLAERRVRFVRDHELVRVAADGVVVAREPGVGLDGDRRRLGRGLALLDDRGQALAVALGRELAVELRDEQPAVREDQDAHRARRLDESGGGDRLAGRGRVPESVAADRAGILRRGKLLLDLVLVDDAEVRILLLGLRRLDAPLPFRGSSSARWLAAISSVSIPASASTWWRRSSVPEARCGGFSERTRSRPSMSANRTFHCEEGASRPASISASASSSALRRAVPCASTSVGSSPLWSMRLAGPVLGLLCGCDEVVRRRSW